jgi:hypothetical protein
MEPSERIGSLGSPLPDVRYYKSDRRPLPIIFEQKKRLWRSYAPGGVLLISKPGRIPAETLATLEEIDEVEAKRWLQGEMAEVTHPSGMVTVKDTTPVEPVYYEPRRWRQLLFGPALVFVVIYVAFAAWRIVIALRHPDLGRPYEVLFGLFLLAVVLVAALLSLFRGRHSPFAIALTDTKISGRTCGLTGGLSTFSLDELDRARSARRSLTGRVLGWQCLYSRKGRRIVFMRRHFDGETIRGLLDRLGIEA